MATKVVHGRDEIGYREITHTEINTCVVLRENEYHRPSLTGYSPLTLWLEVTSEGPSRRRSAHIARAAAEDLGGLGGLFTMLLRWSAGVMATPSPPVLLKEASSARRSFEEPARLPLAPLILRRARPSPAPCCSGMNYVSEPRASSARPHCRLTSRRRCACLRGIASLNPTHARLDKRSEQLTHYRARRALAGQRRTFAPATRPSRRWAGQMLIESLVGRLMSKGKSATLDNSVPCAAPPSGLPGLLRASLGCYAPSLRPSLRHLCGTSWPSPRAARGLPVRRSAP